MTTAPWQSDSDRSSGPQQALSAVRWEQALTAIGPEEALPTRGAPAWAGSLLLHMLGVLLLALLVRPPAAPGDPQERELQASIVLKQIDARGEYYEGEHDQPREAETAAAQQAADPLDVLPAESEVAFDPAAALPDARFGAAFSDPTAGAAGGNPHLGEGPAGPDARAIEGGRARTSVFGLEAEGYSFVYVFDASGSMGGWSGRPLAAAKRHLLASLESLDETHRFQIIFYNNDPRVLNLSGQEGAMVFATELNKAQAGRFVEGVRAELGTDHMPALTIALRMRPDVIFFLTDADDPVLTEDEFRRLARMNAGGAAIYCIEFGTGGQPSRINWLRRLAHEHRGKYTYVNVRELGPQ